MKRGPYQKNKGLKCAERGCKADAYTKGLCKRHWQAQYMPAYRLATKKRERLRAIANRDRYRKTPHARAVANAANKIWHAKHPEVNRRYRRNNKEHIRELQLARSYKTRHGSTLADYNRLLTAQKSCCAICKRPASDFKRRLHFDHCHRTSRPRGLLCAGCNIAIGHLEKSAAKARSMLAYLKKYQ